MNDQIILGADENGNFTGEYFPKTVGHTGEGKHHLAITVQIYNVRGEMLLQKRKHKIFDNIWDMTASTHPLHREDGKDETFEEAVHRALKMEYGIDHVELQTLGGFNYFAKYGEHCENEHDYLLLGEYNGDVNLNPEAGYSYKWMPKQEFLKDVEENPESYTPWAIEGVKLLKRKDFFV
ncbi:MAG: isopentenyl-diphosphate delta-isomerase [Microgenomates group bacterium Gr01-1014_93]|nr:MAG: isopentenyl-diphosphate delta-isomerase [Microgenomates group bacterium Gr01-1014_93]